VVNGITFFIYDSFRNIKGEKWEYKKGREEGIANIFSIWAKKNGDPPVTIFLRIIVP